MQANGQCCEDNPDALNMHELLLPGHLLLKFMKEQLENCLESLIQQVTHCTCFLAEDDEQCKGSSTAATRVMVSDCR